MVMTLKNSKLLIWGGGGGGGGWKRNHWTLDIHDSCPAPGGGGGGLPFERDGDARRLA